jgi:hypothetical protein
MEQGRVPANWGSCQACITHYVKQQENYDGGRGVAGMMLKRAINGGAV